VVETELGGRPHALREVELALAWGVTDSGEDEVRASAAPAGTKAWQLEFDDVGAPWWPRKIDRLEGRLLSSLVGRGTLLNLVYELLDRDMESLFGWDLWRKRW
jgi:hypothetical protein